MILCKKVVRRKPYYGHTLAFVLYVITGPILLGLIITVAIISQLSLVIIMVIALFFLLSVGYVILFKKNYMKIRNLTLKKLIELADLDGNETVLDLGTGLGFVAINFAKIIKNGKVYGIDKWRWLPFTISKIVLTMMFGSSEKAAKRNAELEGVTNKCIFINQSFTEKLGFPDNYFNIVCSSYSLYFVEDSDQRGFLFTEIDRVLKKNGKIIFVEPKKSSTSWNVETVKTFFESIDYKINILTFPTPDRWVVSCVLYGKKLDS
jgi:SAM-dependent methyltransferase